MSWLVDRNRSISRPPTTRSPARSHRRRSGARLRRSPEQHVDVAVAGARGCEREPLAVGGKHRPRFSRRMRHEEPRVAPARGHLPDVAAADERDRRAVGRDPRLGEGWQGPRRRASEAPWTAALGPRSPAANAARRERATPSSCCDFPAIEGPAEAGRHVKYHRRRPGGIAACGRDQGGLCTRSKEWSSRLGGRRPPGR